MPSLCLGIWGNLTHVCACTYTHRHTQQRPAWKAGCPESCLPLCPVPLRPGSWDPLAIVSQLFLSHCRTPDWQGREQQEATQEVALDSSLSNIYKVSCPLAAATRSQMPAGPQLDLACCSFPPGLVPVFFAVPVPPPRLPPYPVALPHSS